MLIFQVLASDCSAQIGKLKQRAIALLSKIPEEENGAVAKSDVMNLYARINLSKGNASQQQLSAWSAELMGMEKSVSEPKAMKHGKIYSKTGNEPGYSLSLIEGKLEVLSPQSALAISQNLDEDFDAFENSAKEAMGAQYSLLNAKQRRAVCLGWSLATIAGYPGARQNSLGIMYKAGDLMSFRISEKCIQDMNGDCDELCSLYFASMKSMGLDPINSKIWAVDLRKEDGGIARHAVITFEVDGKKFFADMTGKVPPVDIMLGNDIFPMLDYTRMLGMRAINASPIDCRDYVKLKYRSLGRRE